MFEFLSCPAAPENSAAKTQTFLAQGVLAPTRTCSRRRKDPEFSAAEFSGEQQNQKLSRTKLRLTFVSQFLASWYVREKKLRVEKNVF